jgi:hypothetical protein
MEDVIMKQLKVTLIVGLEEDVIQECLDKGYPKDFIIGSVKAHIETAIGNGKILGWEKVVESRVETIEEVTE